MTSATLQPVEEAPVAAAARAALYLRVSTPRQADHDLSIPDQRRQLESYCLTRGWDVAEVFVEPGVSGTDDRRPAFQEMIDAALEKPPAFEVIVVHSFSRFFRDQFQFEFYLRKLAKNGVQLVSITQVLGDDPASEMMRKIMTLFDEYQSKETAKHTLRAMNENARQGFWNGARPPFGYRVVAAEQRGTKTKKKLEIDPIYADVVRRMYRMALEGVDGRGPMGVMAIATWLNENNIRTRYGGRWGKGMVHEVLTRTTYIGEHHFNTYDAKKGRRKPETEHAIMQVPPIITANVFQAVQRSLKARSPKMMPPRAVGGSTLLTGICFCACCGGAMTLRTGTSRLGREYRYYSCATKARQGEKGCPGVSVPMDRLNEAVIEHLEKRLLDPERLEVLMDQLLDRREEWVVERRQHVAELERRATEADAKLSRLYEAIENGLVDMGDSSFKARITELTSIRDQARVDAERAVAHIERISPEITAESLRAFAVTARRKLRHDDGSYARNYIRAVAQRVDVISKTDVRIRGTRTELLRTLTAASGVEAAVLGVRGIGPKWCLIADPNLGERARRLVAGRLAGCRLAAELLDRLQASLDVGKGAEDGLAIVGGALASNADGEIALPRQCAMIEQRLGETGDQIVERLAGSGADLPTPAGAECDPRQHRGPCRLNVRARRSKPGLRRGNVRPPPEQVGGQARRGGRRDYCRIEIRRRHRKALRRPPEKDGEAGKCRRLRAVEHRDLRFRFGHDSALGGDIARERLAGPAPRLGLRQQFASALLISQGDRAAVA